MLRVGALQPLRAAVRYYASAASPRTLVYLEHHEGDIDSGSLSALTAATQLGGNVTGLVVGKPGHIDEVVKKAKKLKGLNTLLHSTSPLFSSPLPEAVAPLMHKVLSSSSYTHFISAHSSSAKGILPRVAATLDLPAISDVTSFAHDSSSDSTTFLRGIYAGNAVTHVRASKAIPIKIFTVRATAFKAAELDGGSAEAEAVEAVSTPDIQTEHIRTEITKSDRPELGSASRVVSGGRALKDAETFKKTIDPLADILGAAVGASRAAVDAGYVDNSLQVGQTGKVVAPELYMAIGISGAIQHLAGMKDSKMIVAINKASSFRIQTPDADAPIFQVADAGLVADLYSAVPELIEKLKQ
ncbi:electron transfer flavoprotein alpha subunit [Hysterangium stoloniferum]|nr:electron transfer flavoprotein alpha subunit [Hysterangium stoloniferum]